MTPSTRRPCGSSPLCGRCTSRRVIRRCWRTVGKSLTTNCASCHGGAKWTKSQIFHRDNPAAVAQNMAPLDPGVTRLNAAPPVSNLVNEFFSFTCNARTIKYLEDVGTFDITNPIEIRDNAAASTAFGVNGFNSSSLFSINYHAPYLHRGQAQTLDAVFPLHTLPAAGGGPSRPR